MSEKQRGEVDFSFKKGCFREYSGYEPIQLYQFYEREIHAVKLLEPPVFSAGFCLIYCVSGEAIISSAGVSLPLKSETIFFCSADRAYTIEPTDHHVGLRIVCLNLQISDKAYSSFSLIGLCKYFLNIETPLVADSAPELNGLFSRFVSELSISSQTSTAIIKGLLYQVLILAYRRFNRPNSLGFMKEPTVHAVGHTVYAIIRYVDDHLFSMHNLTNMATELGYSYNYLSHLFRRKTGMTIQAYVSQKKIEKSVELLLDNRLSITEIAALLNYDCIQSFSKAFRRAMAMSPTEYRLLKGVTE